MLSRWRRLVTTVQIQNSSIQMQCSQAFHCNNKQIAHCKITLVFTSKRSLLHINNISSCHINYRLRLNAINIRSRAFNASPLIPNQSPHHSERRMTRSPLERSSVVVLQDHHSPSLFCLHLSKNKLFWKLAGNLYTHRWRSRFSVNDLSYLWPLHDHPFSTTALL